MVSSPPEATQRPSGEKATAVTAPLWPRKRWGSAPEIGPILTVPSDAPARDQGLRRIHRDRHCAVMRLECGLHLAVETEPDELRNTAACYSATPSPKRPVRLMTIGP